MIGSQASGDGGLDLLAVQRDDELLDLLGARAARAVATTSWCACWSRSPTRSTTGCPVPCRPHGPRRTPFGPGRLRCGAAVPGRPATDLLPAGVSSRRTVAG